MTRARQSPSIVLVAASAWLISILLAWWDPLALTSAARQSFANLYANTTSGVFPNSRRPNTAAILLTDYDVQLEGMSWPLAHAQQAAIIEAIAAASPRSILIDFFFVDDRGDPGSAGLIATIERVACETSVFVIAPPAQTAPRAGTVWSEFYVRHQNGSGECPVHLVSATVDRGAAPNTYRFATEAGSPPSYPSALLAQVDVDVDAFRLSAHPLPGLSHEHIELRWALPPRSRCDWIEDSLILSVEAESYCRDLTRNPAVRLGRQILNSLNLQTSSPVFPEVSIAYTPPVPTFAISELQNRNSPAFFAMRDAHVVYGSYVTGVDDFVDSPVYVSELSDGVPGVFAHLMAAENALALQRRVTRVPADPAWLVRFDVVITLLCALAFVGIAHAMARRRVLVSAIAASASVWLGLLLLFGAIAPVSPSAWALSPFIFIGAVGFANQLIYRIQSAMNGSAT